MVKILFLHGYAQHPEEISSKAKQILKAMPDAEFVFPRAAVQLVSYDGDLEDRSRRPDYAAARYAWNFSEEDMSTHLINVEASWTHLTPILEQQGPFDGIMGFSQGAAVASALCAHLEKHDHGIDHPAFKFAVLFCGARPLDDTFDHLYHDIRTPSLHLVGRQDVMVPRSRSLGLAECFETATVAYHPGNHFIPQGLSCTSLVRDFVITHTSAPRPMPRAMVSLEQKTLSEVPLKAVSNSGSPVAKLMLMGRNVGRTRLIRRPSLPRMAISC